jgi:hypothetical protein
MEWLCPHRPEMALYVVRLFLFAPYQRVTNAAGYSVVVALALFWIILALQLRAGTSKLNS